MLGLLFLRADCGHRDLYDYLCFLGMVEMMEQDEREWLMAVYEMVGIILERVRKMEKTFDELGVNLPPPNKIKILKTTVNKSK